MAVSLKEDKISSLSDMEKAILQAISRSVEHDILEVTIIEDQGCYFAYNQVGDEKHRYFRDKMNLT